MKRAVPSEIYYKRFKLLTFSLLWKHYINWSYHQGIDDLLKHKIPINFSKKHFSALLCGTSGEVTAREFILFILKKNPKAKITIIDYGEKQVASVKKLVHNSFFSYSIVVKQLDATQLTKHFPKHSFDWIDTDGFLEYFDHKSLTKLLHEWQMVIKSNGFITLREFSSCNYFDDLLDYTRIFLGKFYLGVTMYKHSSEELANIFTQAKFTFLMGSTAIPSYKRYCLIPSH